MICNGKSSKSINTMSSLISRLPQFCVIFFGEHLFFPGRDALRASPPGRKKMCILPSVVKILEKGIPTGQNKFPPQDKKRKTFWKTNKNFIQSFTPGENLLMEHVYAYKT